MASSCLLVGLIATVFLLTADAAKDKRVACPDGQSYCPKGTTCCQLAGGQYGCCPLPSAVCCNDHMHCCPEHTQCDLQHMTCLQDDGSARPIFRKFPASTDAAHRHDDDDDEDVICPDQSTKCPPHSTCCSLDSAGRRLLYFLTKPRVVGKISKRYGCCPAEHAVCCADHAHCCPSGTQCATEEGKCIGMAFGRT